LDPNHLHLGSLSLRQPRESLMADTQKLARELANLDDVDWFAVLTEAQAQRRDKFGPDGSGEEPHAAISRDDFATWMAQRHLASDPDIREVIYLPFNAPQNVVRFLEINVLLNISDEGKIEPVDFSPDINQLNFQVLVADITPTQWERIEAKQLSLPSGWDLRDCRMLGRDSKHE